MVRDTVLRDFIRFTVREEVMPLDRRADIDACGPKPGRLLQIRSCAFKFLAPQAAALLMIPWHFATVLDGLRLAKATLGSATFGTAYGCQAEEAYDRRHFADAFIRVAGACRYLDTYFRFP